MNTNVATIEQKPQSALATIRQDLDKMAGQFEAALPKHIPTERFKRVVLTAIQNNPELLDCDRRSLWNAAMRAAQDGLLPDGRDGAMVVRKTQSGKAANWQVMVGGIRKKVRNSDEIATWDAHAVYEKDEFAFELGDEPYIKHKPYMGGDRGKIVAAYSVAVLKSGEKSREVMSAAEIFAIRDRYSDGWKAFKANRIKSTPWHDAEAEMCRKTVVRRHSKVLPMSTDLDDLLRRDDDIVDVREEVRQRQQAERATGTNVLDVFAGAPNQSDETPVETVDQETGEITDEAPPKQIAEDSAEEPSAADAYERGRQDRRDKKALKASPGEWRDGQHQAPIDAREAGWRVEDAQEKDKP
jgi:recombination protein RecT